MRNWAAKKKVRAKAHIWWLTTTNIRNAIWLFKRGLEALFGKIMIIDSRDIRSNADYNYYQLEISKLPVSKENQYLNY